MPGWLGIALAVAFGLVAVQRCVRRDAPGSVMAAGMAAMSLGMTGGQLLAHGAWWTAGFAGVAVWPLVRPPCEGVCGGPAAHLLGGVAMIYMFVMPGMGPMGGSESLRAIDAVALTGHHAMAGVAGAHRAMAGMSPVELPGPPMTGPYGAAPALLGWGLSCCFLLLTVVALTRRDIGGAPTAPRIAVLGEAAMAFGTAVMLVASS
jgi:hypothetical protein